MLAVHSGNAVCRFRCRHWTTLPVRRIFVAASLKLLQNFLQSHFLLRLGRLQLPFEFPPNLRPHFYERLLCLLPFRKRIPRQIRNQLVQLLLKFRVRM